MELDTNGLMTVELEAADSGRSVGLKGMKLSTGSTALVEGAGFVDTCDPEEADVVGVDAEVTTELTGTVLAKLELSTIVDLTTAAFILNQAETQRDVIDTNVWQALLYKAASTGDFGLFINEF